MKVSVRESIDSFLAEKRTKSRSCHRHFHNFIKESFADKIYRVNVCEIISICRKIDRWIDRASSDDIWMG